MRGERNRFVTVQYEYRLSALKSLTALMPHIDLTNYWSWAQKGGWAVLDQALFAGTNFLVGVLLARWLTPTAYGAFSTAYSVFILAGALHTALWTEPMLVYGSGRFRKQYTHYQKLLLNFHWRYGLIAGGLFFLLSILFFALTHPELGRSFLGLTLAMPLILYMWLMRRGTYIILKPQLAVYGGVLYLVLYMGLSAGLLKLGWLNETGALICMGVAALFAGSLIHHLQKKRTHSQEKSIRLAEVLRLHWEYGRWALLAGVLSWVPGNIYFLALSAFHGLEATAALKALMNMVLPVLHFNIAIAGLFVPVFVRRKEHGKLLSGVLYSLGTLLLSSLGYWPILLIFGRPLMEWLYAGKYSGSELLPWLGLIPITVAIMNTIGAMLRAVERPDLVARLYTFTALASLSIGIGLVYLAGLNGAVTAIVSINFSSALVFAVQGARSWKKACI